MMFIVMANTENPTIIKSSANITGISPRITRMSGLTPSMDSTKSLSPTIIPISAVKDRMSVWVSTSFMITQNPANPIISKSSANITGTRPSNAFISGLTPFMASMNANINTMIPVSAVKALIIVPSSTSFIVRQRAMKPPINRSIASTAARIPNMDFGLVVILEEYSINIASIIITKLSDANPLARVFPSNRPSCLTIFANEAIL